jgi:hypothetical protein
VAGAVAFVLLGGLAFQECAADAGTHDAELAQVMQDFATALSKTDQRQACAFFGGCNGAPSSCSDDQLERLRQSAPFLRDSKLSLQSATYGSYFSVALADARATGPRGAGLLHFAFERRPNAGCWGGRWVLCGVYASAENVAP